MEVCKVDAPHLGMLGDDNYLSIVTFYDLAGRSGTQFMALQTIPDTQSWWSRYANYIHEKYIKSYLRLHKDAGHDHVRLRYVLQGDDCTRNIRSVAWEGQRDWKDVTLIPDPYYFAGQGYLNFLPEGAPLPQWSARRAAIVWRGSTTGVVDGGHGVGFRADTLERLPRYRLCQISDQLGAAADVGFVSIVQCADMDRDAVTARLELEGRMASYIPSQQMTRFKFLVDIDGNANSWNFVQRLRMGCCILKIDSPWIQWFDIRIKPWVHYVPVKADLSDLLEKAEWCLTHDGEAEQIAGNARALGLSITFEEEMRQAALSILRVSEPLSTDSAHLAALYRVCDAAGELGEMWSAAIAARPSFPTPVWLQTAHGTLLGCGEAGEGLIQVCREGDRSQAIKLHDDDPASFALLGNLRIDRIGNEMSLEDQGRFLSAQPDLSSVTCDRTVKDAWETFHLIPAF